MRYRSGSIAGCSYNQNIILIRDKNLIAFPIPLEKWIAAGAGALDQERCGGEHGQGGARPGVLRVTCGASESRPHLRP